MPIQNLATSLIQTGSRVLLIISLCALLNACALIAESPAGTSGNVNVIDTSIHSGETSQAGTDLANQNAKQITKIDTQSQNTSLFGFAAKLFRIKRSNSLTVGKNSGTTQQNDTLTKPMLSHSERSQDKETDNQSTTKTLANNDAPTENITPTPTASRETVVSVDQIARRTSILSRLSAIDKSTIGKTENNITRNPKQNTATDTAAHASASSKTSSKANTANTANKSKPRTEKRARATNIVPSTDKRKVNTEASPHIEAETEQQGLSALKKTALTQAAMDGSMLINITPANTAQVDHMLSAPDNTHTRVQTPTNQISSDVECTQTSSTTEKQHFFAIQLMLATKLSYLKDALRKLSIDSSKVNIIRQTAADNRIRYVAIYGQFSSEKEAQKMLDHLPEDILSEGAFVRRVSVKTRRNS